MSDYSSISRPRQLYRLQKLPDQLQGGQGVDQRRAVAQPVGYHRPQNDPRPAPGGVCVYALLPLPAPLVRFGLPHRSDAKKGRRDRFCGRQPLRRLQILHAGLSLGGAPMEPGDPQG